MQLVKEKDRRSVTGLYSLHRLYNIKEKIDAGVWGLEVEVVKCEILPIIFLFDQRRIQLLTILRVNTAQGLIL